MTDLLLAQLIQEQEDIHTHQRKKRQLPLSEHNVFFVVELSSSIGDKHYQRALKVLAEFAELFCGEVGIGLTSFSLQIELEFCPTCYQCLPPTNRMKVAMEHMVPCLLD